MGNVKRDSSIDKLKKRWKSVRWKRIRGGPLWAYRVSLGKRRLGMVGVDWLFGVAGAPVPHHEERYYANIGGEELVGPTLVSTVSAAIYNTIRDARRWLTAFDNKAVILYFRGCAPKGKECGTCRCRPRDCGLLHNDGVEGGVCPALDAFIARDAGCSLWTKRE